MFLSLLLAGTLSAADANPVAATVNGETILLADVDAMLSRHKPGGPLTSAQTKLLRQAVLDELIDEALMGQYLQKHWPATDAKEVENHIAALAEAQKKQGKTLKDFTRETGLTETRLRASFDAAIRWQKLVESRTNDVGFKAYFEANRPVFEGATVRLSHIVMRLSPTPTDGEIAAAKETLRLLKADIEDGRIRFADAAKKHSICPTAKSGGDLGTIGRKDGQVEESIAAAAFELPVHGISSPVRSPAGLHLLMVTQRSAGTPTTYEKSAEAVKEAYADEMRTKLLEEMRKTADLRISLP
jgi:peptidyl-prolyl cis-trans isomerase C